jgi:hypothetical protein
MSKRVREVTGFKKEPRESWPRLGSEKTRRRSVRPEPREREGKMATGSLTPNSANDIK